MYPEYTKHAHVVANLYSLQLRLIHYLPYLQGERAKTAVDLLVYVSYVMNLSRESLCGVLVVVTVDIWNMLFSGLVEVKVEKQLERCVPPDVGIDVISLRC